MIASGIGLLLARILWSSYHESKQLLRPRSFLLLWCCLWLIRIPLVYWYYSLRQDRFDYPIWGDSIGIPIFTDSLAMIAGAAISSIFLAVTGMRYDLPKKIRPVRPATVPGWCRSVFFGLWLAFLGIGILEGIVHGDEGIVIAGLPACVILLAWLSSSRKSAPETVNEPDTSKEPEGPEAQPRE